MKRYASIIWGLVLIASPGIALGAPSCPAIQNGDKCVTGKFFCGGVCKSPSEYPAQPSQSQGVFQCNTCSWQCDTQNFPCGGCTAATSTAGAPVNDDTGRVYVNQCGGTSCPAGTSLIGGKCVGIAYLNLSTQSAPFYAGAARFVAGATQTALDITGLSTFRNAVSFLSEVFVDRSLIVGTTLDVGGDILARANLNILGNVFAPIGRIVGGSVETEKIVLAPPVSPLSNIADGTIAYIDNKIQARLGGQWVDLALTGEGGDGVPGPKGDPGAQGPAGQDGATVVSVAINPETGIAIFTLSDGSTVSTTTSLVGPKGEAGANGASGADGVSVQSAQVGDDGVITFTLTNGETLIASGNARGPQGEQGPAGPQGEKGDPGEQGPVGPAGPLKSFTGDDSIEVMQDADTVSIKLRDGVYVKLADVGRVRTGEVPAQSGGLALSGDILAGGVLRADKITAGANSIADGRSYDVVLSTGPIRQQLLSDAIDRNASSDEVSLIQGIPDSLNFLNVANPALYAVGTQNGAAGYFEGTGSNPPFSVQGYTGSIDTDFLSLIGLTLPGQNLPGSIPLSAGAVGLAYPRNIGTNNLSFSAGVLGAAFPSPIDFNGEALDTSYAGLFLGNVGVKGKVSADELETSVLSVSGDIVAGGYCFGTDCIASWGDIGASQSVLSVLDARYLVRDIVSGSTAITISKANGTATVGFDASTLDPRFINSVGDTVNGSLGIENNVTVGGITTAQTLFSLGGVIGTTVLSSGPVYGDVGRFANGIATGEDTTLLKLKTFDVDTSTANPVNGIVLDFGASADIVSLQLMYSTDPAAGDAQWLSLNPVPWRYEKSSSKLFFDPGEINISGTVRVLAVYK